MRSREAGTDLLNRFELHSGSVQVARRARASDWPAKERSFARTDTETMTLVAVHACKRTQL